MNWSILSGTSLAITADRTGGTMPVRDARPAAAHPSAPLPRDATPTWSNANVKIRIGAIVALLFAATATVVVVAGWPP